MLNERSPLSRRTVLKSGAAALAASTLPRWFLEENAARAAPEESKSPNEKPGILLIGCGDIMRWDIAYFRNFGNIVAVCDVDKNRAGAVAEKFSVPKIYSDFRKAMEDKGVDVVHNATPDHWHTLINIHALRSGKDVYTQKPLTLTIDEGKKLVEVVKDTGRILQTGSQQRSNYPNIRLACELVRNGRIGKLEHIITQLPGGPIEGPFPAMPVPPELDWDFWLGQAPKVDYTRNRCHKQYRFWYDYSGGTVTDWGAHHNDIAQWANDTERSGPVSVEGKVLEPPVPGGYTSVEKYQIEYEYANGVRLTCKSVKSKPSREITSDDERDGVRFEGSDGWIFVNRNRLAASDPEILTAELPAGAIRLRAPVDRKHNSHFGNFYDCVRSRETPVADVEIGHRSVSVCHIGVLSLRLGRKLAWDPSKEEFVNDSEANSYLAREMRKPWSYDAV